MRAISSKRILRIPNMPCKSCCNCLQDAWGKSVQCGDKILMLADGNAQFTKAIGAELDLTDKGLGMRSR